MSKRIYFFVKKFGGKYMELKITKNTKAGVDIKQREKISTMHKLRFCCIIASTVNIDQITTFVL